MRRTVPAWARFMTERWLLDRLASPSTSTRVRLARAVTLLGETPVVWAAVGGAAVRAAVRSRNPASALTPLAVLSSATVLRRMTASTIGRSRPPEQLWRTRWTGPSFPSRHTTLATVGAHLVADTLAVRHRHVSRAAAWTVAVAVGVSRLVLGVHWPTDLLGGWGLAAAILRAGRGPTQIRR